MLLCALWGTLLAVELLCRSVLPAVILPKPDLPLLLAVCLTALLLEHWMGLPSQRSWLRMTALAAVTFGILALCAGEAEGMQALKLALTGGGVFFAAGGAFDAIAQRIAGGPYAPAAYPMAAVLLFLAGQSLTHILF